MTLNPTHLPQPELRSVLILQRILAPYRLAFFQSLARSSELALTLAYGQASEDSALESISSPCGIETLPMKNTYFGKNERVIWQSGTLPLVGGTHHGTVIAEFNPRIITNVLACLLARHRGLKFLWWGHGFRPKSGPIDKLIYLWLATRADAMIFYTPAGANGLIARGMPPEKAFVAWNSIDTEEIHALTQKFVPQERHRILCIGRLIPEKKVDLLIRGFAQAVSQLTPETMLTIIGEGPQRETLEALVQELGLNSRVEFIGSLYDQARLAPYFNTSCVSVSTGYVGLSAIHSLAYGVPMIVADKEPHSPEIAAIEDGVNSVFFRANNTKDLAAKMTDLLQSPAQLQQMSDAAKTGALRSFSLSAMVQAFEQAVQYAHEAHSVKPKIK